MNNPFSRLKHYVASEIDPQENHATECLAACLVFSPKVRSAFIAFLAGDEAQHFKSPDPDVETQCLTETGEYVDLVLRRQGEFVIAVEIKVRSPENCDHHRNQLRAYRKWLDEQEEPQRRLFTLVRNPDNTFRPDDHGASGRRTWAGLHKCLKALLNETDLPESESNLINSICDYLESEAIVSVYKIEDLLRYEDGLRARKAVTAIFSQISSQLEIAGFKTDSIEDRKDFWPQLRIQHPRWERLFGTGVNRKLTLWFCVPGIWQATAHSFAPEIELWHQDHGNDWQFVRSKLPVWLDNLKSQQFNWTVFTTWSKRRENFPPQDIREAPKRITAWRDGDSVDLDGAQIHDEDQLIRRLAATLQEYAQIIDSLNP
jgi:hypothetical protein